MFNSIRSKLLLDIFIVAVVLFITTVWFYFLFFKEFEGAVVSFSDNIIDSMFHILHADHYSDNEKDQFKPFHFIRINRNKEVFVYNKETNPYLKIKETCKVVNNSKANCIDEFIKKSANYKEAVSIISKKITNGKTTEGDESEVRTKFIKQGDEEYYISVIYQKSVIKTVGEWIVISICFVIFIFLTIIFLLLSCQISKITNPLAILSHQLERLANYDFSNGDAAELKAGLPVAEKNEIGRFAQAFAVMTDKLTENIHQLIATTTRAERMQSELNVARDIQLGSLPKNFSFAAEKGIELHAYLVPAREIGGDLYDFFFIDDDHICIAVGDVADKGVPAALFMVIVKKLISSKAIYGGSSLSPAELMDQMNEILCKDNLSATFVTLFIGILNVKSGELRYANGGHVPPLFTNGGNTPFFRKELSGPVVGVISGINYKELGTALLPGEAVFLCTDGITEAMNENDEIFGEKRLLTEFDRMNDLSCTEVVTGILAAVKSHAGKAPQSDDIAMLMVRFL